MPLTLVRLSEAARGHVPSTRSAISYGRSGCLSLGFSDPRAWVTRLLLALGLALALAPAPAPAAVRITEFLAQNNGGHRDADGESPDWVELHNDGAAPASLTGWHLTDSPANLTKWTFPATAVGPGGFLVVFASGKNRALSGAELHTNFELDQSGGYLALVQPDGATIAQSLTYTGQRANVSVGFGRSSVTLLPASGPARVHVPADGALGLTWIARDFNDSGWFSSNAPVGFSVNVTLSTVLSVDFNERAQDPAATTLAGFQSFLLNSNISATAIQTQATTRALGAYTLTVSNTAPHGCDDRLRATPLNAGALTESLLLRDFIFSRDDTGTGGLDVWLSGLVPHQIHRLTLWSYDSGSPGVRVADWSANGVLSTNNYSFDGNVLQPATRSTNSRSTRPPTVRGASFSLAAATRRAAADWACSSTPSASPRSPRASRQPDWARSC